MEKDTDRMAKKKEEQERIRGLMQDLSLYGQSSANDSEISDEPIDMMVDQVLHGVDIRKRHPAFYRKLLQNKHLRQQFIDALSSFTSSSGKSIDPYLGSTQFDFSFLKKNRNVFSDWPIFLNQPRQKLIEILFAIEPNFRSAVDPGAEPVYTLLRKDFILSGISYSVTVNSKLESTQEDVLATTISLTADNDVPTGVFPVQASLRWGAYSADLSIDQEGKYKLPDIPLALVLDEDLAGIKSDLYLSLSSAH